MSEAIFCPLMSTKKEKEPCSPFCHFFIGTDFVTKAGECTIRLIGLRLNKEQLKAQKEAELQDHP